MMDDADPFKHSPAQGNLFGGEEGRIQVLSQSTLPDPEDIRRRLGSLVDQVRSAETMPWSERDARMWRIVFPNMARWLPEDEAEQLRFEFFQELDRLSRAA